MTTQVIATPAAASSAHALPSPVGQALGVDGAQQTAALSVPSQTEPAATFTVPSGDGFDKLTPTLAALPVQLDLSIPVPKFRVQDLLSLEKGRVLETAWPATEDLPLWSGDVQFVWTEFEVIEQKLGVRITRLV